MDFFHLEAGFLFGFLVGWGRGWGGGGVLRQGFFFFLCNVAVFSAKLLLKDFPQNLLHGSNHVLKNGIGLFIPIRFERAIAGFSSQVSCTIFPYHDGQSGTGRQIIKRLEITC